MTNSGLATPPRAAPPRTSPQVPEPALEPEVPRRRDSFERVLGWSLLASVLSHLLFLLLSPVFIQTQRPPGGTVPQAREVWRSTGLEIIEVVPSADAPDLPPEQETAEVPPFFQRPPTAATPADPGPPVAGGPPPSADTPPAPSTREALQPGYRDPRLYVAPRPLPDLDRTDHERYMDHVQARIDAVNDSMAVAADRNRRTSDWTVSDGSGGRWGLSPDGLHLGGVTIPRALVPLPGATGDNRSLQAERDRLRERDEIQRQEADRERARTERERIEAIREQQDVQRAGENR
jgi:hypothetical protein